MNLPQYAAQAVADIERLASRIKDEDYRASLLSVADTIRSSVHIVLPPNGAIYRDDRLDIGSRFPMPTDDEVASFVGLPSANTCFEFDWVDSEQVKRKVVAIVQDGKQLNEPIDQVAVIAVIQGPDSHGHRFMPIVDYMCLAAPLKCAPEGGFVGGAVSLVPKEFNPNPDIALEVQLSLNAAIQCCHALRAGATLKEVNPSPLDSLKCARLASEGVHGFTYHVLKLPAHAQESTSHGGSHASPRLHLRRAHIRKLSSGALTFVRRCFVGKRELGIVCKHYAVSARAA